MAVRLVIASVVWTERTLVAWSVSRWAGSTAALMDECSAELRAALTAVTSAVEMVLVKVVQMDASTAGHSAVSSAGSWVASMGETTVGTMDACWAGRKAAPTDAPWVAQTDASTAEWVVVSVDLKVWKMHQYVRYASGKCVVTCINIE